MLQYLYPIILVVLFYPIVKIYQYCKKTFLNLLFNLELAKLEKKYKSTIIFIVDKKIFATNNNIFKIKNHSEIVELINDCNENIIIILHSKGGSIFSSDIIFNSLLIFDKQITSYIPKYALSAATIIALASNKIFMNKYAYLSPTDPQIGFEIENISMYCASKVLSDYINLMKNFKQVNSIVALTALDAKTSHNDNINSINKILLKRNINVNKHDEIINLFCSGEHPHDKPIYFEDIKGLGFNAKLGIPNDIQKLFEFYLKLEN